MIERLVIKTIATNNSKLVYIYKDLIWQKNKGIIQKISSTPIEDLVQEKQFVEFAKDSIDFFNNANSIKVNFYDMNGKIFLSSNSKNIEEKYIIEKESLIKVIVYYIDSILLKKYFDNTQALREAYYDNVSTHITIRTAEDKRKGLSNFIVRNFVPIKSSIGLENKIEGIIEIITDASSTMKTINSLENRMIISFIILFIAVFAIIVNNTHKAQKIIDSQHEINMILQEAKTRAETESSEKTEFLANVSHELRTPLNAIIGFSEIIQSEAYGPIAIPQYKDYINDINNSGKHLLGVINDILDFSKASADKLKVESIDVDLTKMAIASMRFVKPRADSNQIKLIENLPEEHIIIKADPKRLKQALLNLLSNAVKFTPENGSVTLEINKDSFNEYVYIKVIDTGIGISEKDLPKALSSFGQVDNKLSRKYEGTGLGLPLTKKLIELMNGEFDINSIQGKGTTVTLKFKLDTDHIKPDSFIEE